MTDTSDRADRKIIYLEPFSGISGDMTIGALLDMGFDFDELEEKLNRLPLKEYHLSSQKCHRSGIQATKFDVHVGQRRANLRRSPVHP